MSTAARITLNITRTLALSLAALTAPAQTQDQHVPVIRKTTRLVQLNVVVLDNHKRPVGDLPQADFEVFDNGREQKLSHFSMSSTPAPRARSAQDPLVLTNRPGQAGETLGTVTILLVDEVIDRNVQASYFRTVLQSIRPQVLKFLGTLPPGQQVALYELRAEGVVVAQELTDNPPALIAAAKKIGAGQLKEMFSLVGATPDTASAAGVRKTGITEDLRIALVKQAFRGIAHHLQGTPVRKNIIWISPTFPALVTGFDPALMAGERDTILPNPWGSSAPQFANPEGYYNRLQALARQMSDGNISVYPIDTKGLFDNAGVSPRPLFTGPFVPGVSRPITVPPGGTSPANAVNDQPAYAPPNPSSVSGASGERQAMDLLASETGGRAFYDSNGLDEDLQKVVEEGRVAYLLGYYPADSAWNGKYHHVEVRLKRPGLSVLCRKGYFATDEPLPKDSDTALRDAAKGMLEWSGIGVTLSVSSNPLEWLDQEMVVKLDTQEIHFENKDGRWRAQLDVVFAQLAKDGRILESVKDHLDLALLPETYNDAAIQGWLYPRTVDVNPKAEKLRVVVRDHATGAVGSVSIPIYHRKAA